MKINIMFKFESGAWGGGNQFLKALKNYFIEQNIYEHDIKKANVILFNSHHKLDEIVSLKEQHPEKIFIHRVDGPIFKIRGRGLELDMELYKINSMVANGTIFQSEWSKEENYKQGMMSDNNTTILNSPDPKIFNKIQKASFSKNRKTKLIATSWSNNMKKGFDVYKYLDDTLDFSKYEMVFIGNSPIKFKNIKWIKPLRSEKLAKQLKQHDIFITASQNDPCSNSLIEALHCGLPAIALNDGGHGEIIRTGGELFKKEKNIPEKITKIIEYYSTYQDNINMPSMNDVGNKYIEFIKGSLP